MTTSTKTTCVRRATPADQPAIFEFCRQAYGERAPFKVPERWYWQFRDNPFCEPDAPPVWLALDGTDVVGQSCALKEPIQVGAEVCRVGWSVDTVVLPRYRGQGFGSQLQSQNQAAHDVFMSIKMSEGNARIKSRLGAIALPPVHLLQRHLEYSSTQLVERIARRSRTASALAHHSGLAAIGSRAGSRYTAWAWQRRVRQMTAETQHITIEEVDQFDDALQELWQHVSPCFDLAVSRTPDYLNWKFGRQPHVNHRRFIARHDKRVVGYIVFRVTAPPEPVLGVILDAFAHPDDTATTRKLIATAVDQCRRHGCPKVKAATSHPALLRAYRQLGFSDYRRRTPMCHLKETRFSPAARRRLASGPITYFAYGDHDLDQYPLAK